MSISASELADSTEDLGGFLEKLLPGSSPAAQSLRRQIHAFCDNFLCCGAFLTGPIGCGKSTVARVIALLRLLSLLKAEQRKMFVTGLKFDGPLRIDKKSMNWYDELNLTGLAPDLADTQLFGIAPRTATYVDGREAMFEKVGHGHGRTVENPTQEAQLTGGVILLDEIADMAPDLQPKLLTVLTGAEVYRVGGETTAFGFCFRGLVLTASWRDPGACRPDGVPYVRPDLLSRLGDYRIQIPSLSQRAEDLPGIVELQIEDLHRRRDQRVSELLKIRYNNASIDNDRLKSHGGRRLMLTNRDMELLGSNDWSRCGEMRGLRQVLERALMGNIPIADALQLQPKIAHVTNNASDIAPLADSILELMIGCPEGVTLPGKWKAVDAQIRRHAQTALLENGAELRRRAAQLGISPSVFRRQLNDLFRQDRTRATEDTA